MLVLVLRPLGDVATDEFSIEQVSRFEVLIQPFLFMVYHQHMALANFVLNLNGCHTFVKEHSNQSRGK